MSRDVGPDSSGQGRVRMNSHLHPAFAGMTTQPIILGHCRLGFEAECAADLARIATRAGVRIDSTFVPGAAFVVAAAHGLIRARWESALACTPPWFARSVFIGDGPHVLSERDRITPLVALARAHEPPFETLWLETPDSNEGKMRSGLCRRLAGPLESAAMAAGLIVSAEPRGLRLHALFTGSTSVFVGTSRG